MIFFQHINLRSVLFLGSMLLISLCGHAQVGIGENTPTAELELKGTDTGIPALHLEPQTDVVGTSSGQLAIIDDILYSYDEVRGKWLSVEATLLTFGLAGSANNQDLEYIGDTELSGPMMPFDGTVVYASGVATGGELDKILFIDVYNSSYAATPVISAPAQYTGYRISNAGINVDFEEGYYAKVRVSNIGGSINNAMIKLWVKWRKDNPTP